MSFGIRVALLFTSALVVFSSSGRANSDPQSSVAPEFPNIEVSTVSDDVAEEARVLLETELPEVKLEVVQTRGARALMAGHGKQLQAMVAEMAKRLGVANDPRDVTVTINGDPNVNAFVMTDPKTKKVQIGLNAGLLGLVRNQDELAMVLAHEMTHANKDMLRFKDDPAKVKDLLKSIPSMASPSQTEELRADLGAIHRMISGGYNPWGGYEFFKRLAKFDGAVRLGDTDASSIRALARFLSTHPASELRMGVVKSFITARQQREDLLNVTSKVNEFSPSIKKLSWRMAAYSAIATVNKKAALKKGALVSAATVGAQVITALVVSPDTASQMGAILSPGTEVMGGVSSVVEYFKLGSASDWAKTWAEMMEFAKSLKDVPLEKAVKVIAGVSSSGFASGWAINKLRLNIKERAFDEAYRHVLSSSPQLRKTRLATSRTPAVIKLHEELMAAGEFDRTGTLVRTIKANSDSISEARNSWFFDLDKKKFKFKDGEFAKYFRERSQTEAIQRQVLLNQLIEDYLPRLSQDNVREIVKVLESQASDIVLQPELAPSYRRMVDGFRRQHPQIAFSTKIERIFAASDNVEKAAAGAGSDNIQAVMRRTEELMTGNHTTVDGKPIKDSKLPNQATKKVSKLEVSSDELQALLAKNLDSWLDEIESPGERGERALALFNRAYGNAIGDSRRKDVDIKFQLDTLDRIKSRWTKTESVRLLFLPKNLYTAHFGETTPAKKLRRRKEAMAPWGRFWKQFNGVQSVVELDDLISSKLLSGQGLNIDEEPLNSVYKLIERRPDLLKTPADVERILDREYFWNRMGTGRTHLDQTILDEMRKKVGASAGADLWKYRPQASEKTQKLIIDRMKAFGMEAGSRSERLKMWQRFVGRGVTATSDRMFAELYDSGTEADKRKLREVSNGRIWEPQLRSRVLKDRIREMPDYQLLVSTSSELNPSRSTQGGRLAALRNVIRAAESEFEGRGSDYDSVVESVLREAKSSQMETRYADRYRGTLGKGQTDLTMRTLSSLTEKVKAMTAEEKWDYILWLRGEKTASEAIEDLFPAVGADRVARMYSLLPDFQKALVIDNVLDSNTGLLPTANIDSKWGRRIVDHLIGSDKGSDPEALKARQVARDVLEAYLDSFNGPGANKSQRTLVLSYMLASKSGDGSNGRVLKQVLEAMGASGVKIGQFIVAADILGESDNQILRQLQDQANVPQRSRIYQDLVKASGGAPLPGKIDDLLGAASVKYAVKAFDVEDGHPFVLKVLREEASATIGQQFARLRAMSDNLTKKHKGKYSVLRSIVRASEEAVNRELKLGNEVQNSADATRMIYEKLDDFEVPKEALIDDSVIRSEFASGASIHDLPLEKRGEAAQRIIDVEGANLFADQDVIYFDPDRHPGNFKIEVNQSDGRIRIRPIDFGQVITISRAERQAVIDLFAQSAILDKTGSTQWSAEKIAKSLGLPAQKVGKLKSALSNGFPAKNRSALASYYTLLAALEDVGHPQPIQFFDFARAVVQHNQYISMVEDSLIAKGKTPEEVRALVRAPRDELTDRVKMSVSDQMGDGAPYGSTDKMRIVWNQGKKKVEEFAAEMTRKPRAGINRIVTAVKDSPAECAAWFANLAK